MPFWPFVRERRNQPIGICHFCVRETQRTARSATPQAVLPPNLRPPLHPVPHTGSVLPPGTICCWICITDLLSYHPTTGVILPSSVLPAPSLDLYYPPGALCCWIHITPPPSPFYSSIPQNVYYSLISALLSILPPQRICIAYAIDFPKYLAFLSGLGWLRPLSLFYS